MCRKINNSFPICKIVAAGTQGGIKKTKTKQKQTVFQVLIIHQLPFQTVPLGIGELIACRMMMSVCKLNVCSKRVELSKSSVMQSSGCGKKAQGAVTSTPSLFKDIKT